MVAVLFLFILLTLVFIHETYPQYPQAYPLLSTNSQSNPQSFPQFLVKFKF